MNYLSSRERKTLSNEPYDITEDDLKEMLRQNERDKEECKRITEMRYRGESGNMITDNNEDDVFLKFCNSVYGGRLG